MEPRPSPPSRESESLPTRLPVTTSHTGSFRQPSLRLAPSTSSSSSSGPQYAHFLLRELGVDHLFDRADLDLVTVHRNVSIKLRGKERNYATIVFSATNGNHPPSYHFLLVRAGRASGPTKRDHDIVLANAAVLTSHRRDVSGQHWVDLTFAPTSLRTLLGTTSLAISSAQSLELNFGWGATNGRAADLFCAGLSLSSPTTEAEGMATLDMHAEAKKTCTRLFMNLHELDRAQDYTNFLKALSEHVSTYLDYLAKLLKLRHLYLFPLEALTDVYGASAWPNIESLFTPRLFEQADAALKRMRDTLHAAVKQLSSADSTSTWEYGSTLDGIVRVLVDIVRETRQGNVEHAENAFLTQYNISKLRSAFPKFHAALENVPMHPSRSQLGFDGLMVLTVIRACRDEMCATSTWKHATKTPLLAERVGGAVKALVDASKESAVACNQSTGSTAMRIVQLEVGELSKLDCSTMKCLGKFDLERLATKDVAAYTCRVYVLEHFLAVCKPHPSALSEFPFTLSEVYAYGNLFATNNHPTGILTPSTRVLGEDTVELSVTKSARASQSALPFKAVSADAAQEFFATINEGLKVFALGGGSTIPLALPKLPSSVSSGTSGLLRAASPLRTAASNTLRALSPMRGRAPSPARRPAAAAAATPVAPAATPTIARTAHTPVIYSAPRRASNSENVMPNPMIRATPTKPMIHLATPASARPAIRPATPNAVAGAPGPLKF